MPGEPQAVRTRAQTFRCASISPLSNAWCLKQGQGNGNRCAAALTSKCLVAGKPWPMLAATRRGSQTRERLKSTLGASAKDMLIALDEMSRVRKQANRLSVYATLKADEDVRIAANQERQQGASALQTMIGEKEAWVTPEIIAIGPEKV